LCPKYKKGREREEGKKNWEGKYVGGKESHLVVDIENLTLAGYEKWRFLRIRRIWVKIWKTSIREEPDDCISPVSCSAENIDAVAMTPQHPIAKANSLIVGQKCGRTVKEWEVETFDGWHVFKRDWRVRKERPAARQTYFKNSCKLLHF
jgi:hypothetical protein